MKKRMLVAVCMLFALAFASLAQTSVDRNEPLKLDPKVRYGVLDNGLRYYIRQNAKPENRVMLQLAVNAGSICETEAQRGLAHFTEHMLFNGTKNFPKNELVSFLQKTGVRFGGDINAYTSFDETVYMLEIPVDKEGMLENGFQVLEDWAHQASMETEAIESERGVIIEEWRMGLGAMDRMRKKVLPVIFGNSLYAERLPIGTLENLKTFKPELIRQFYKDFYRPDLQAVVVVGNIDPDQAEAMIKKHFAGLKNPAKPRARVDETIPDNEEPIFTVATDPEATSSSVEIYIKHPHKAMLTVDDYRTSIISLLASQMFGMRFMELAQDPQSPMVMVQMGESDFVRNTDILIVSGLSKPGMIDRTFALMLQEMNRVDRYGFVETELERAKQSVMSMAESSLKEAANTSSNDLASEYVAHFLKGQAVPGVEAEYAIIESILPGITVEEVTRYIQSRITENNMLVIVNAPEKDGVDVPDEAMLKSIYEQSREIEVEPYVDRVSMKPLLELPVKPASGATIVSKDETLGITKVKLSNGIVVTLKPTAFKSDEILMSAYTLGGTSQVEDADYMTAMLASVIQGQSGLGDLDNAMLEKQLSGKKVSYTLGIGNLTTEVSASSSVKDLETMLQLNYLNFTEPRKDGRAAQAVVSRMKGQVRFLVNNPMYFFMDTLSKVVSNYDPRVIVIPPVDKLEAVDSNKAYDFYCSQIADPGAYKYYMVGNFEIGDDLLSLLETYIGSLPVKNTNPTWIDRSVPMHKETVDIKVERGSAEQGMVGIVFRANIDWNKPEEREALQYFKEVMEIKMLETIREEMGGVYSPMLNIEMERDPRPQVTFMVMFGCDPERADELTEAVIDEVKRIIAEGPVEEDMAKVRELRKRNFETMSQKNEFWLSALKNSDYIGTDLRRYTSEAQAKAAEGMTAKKVWKAVRKYFGGMVYTRAVLVPESEE